VLTGAGWYYGVLAEKYEAVSMLPLLPSSPLDNFPLILGGWHGRNVPISETVLKVAGNDDYLSRFYVNAQAQAGATLYVGYTAEPRRMLGHRPEVCYVGSGWILDYTKPEIVRTAKGNHSECLIHRFYRPGLAYEEVFVLNYYVLNGAITTDHKSFDGLRWRRPKQAGGRLEYVAQIQISSSSEQAVRLLAQQIADPIMDYMP
jgi:hypothetical protein